MIITVEAANPAKPVGSLSKVIDRTVIPGYPFWIAGMEDIVGQRPPTPVLDMLSTAQATALKNSGNSLGADLVAAQADGFDGGLPRHALKGLAAGGEAHTVTTRLDFSKEVLKSAAHAHGTELQHRDRHRRTRRQSHGEGLGNGGRTAHLEQQQPRRDRGAVEHPGCGWIEQRHLQGADLQGAKQCGGDDQRQRQQQ